MLGFLWKIIENDWHQNMKNAMTCFLYIIHNFIPKWEERKFNEKFKMEHSVVFQLDFQKIEQ